jgi:hypothetical protein
VFLLGGVVLAGCTQGPEQSQEGPPSVDNRAHALWLDRTAYVGDNSKVGALIEQTGLAAMGSMTFSLQTVTVPYGLEVSYDATGKPFDTVDFTPQATLMLGLVANLDQVDVTSGERTHTFTSDQASRQLGYDVKTLGQDEAKLREYLRSLED